VIRLVWSGVRFARGRAAALGAGIGVAAIAFCLLTASVDVGVAKIKGAVGANWRGAYDLLVLPAKSAQSAGSSGSRKHLVQVNYLSAANSGITGGQYRRIGALPGVGVAAPLAVVGYLLETVYLPVTLSPAAVGASGARVLTVISRYSADQGLSVYPPQGQGYVYITPDRLRQQFNAATGESSMAERLPDGRTIKVCASFSGTSAAQTSPFQTAGGLLLGTCYSRDGTAAGQAQATIAWSFPVLVAGIDPVAENKLTGLGRAVVSGRYLEPDERPAPVAGTHIVSVPLLGSTTSFDGDTDHVEVNLLPASAVQVVRSGRSVATITRQLDAAKATAVMRTTITGAQAWTQLLTNISPAISPDQVNSSQGIGQYWTAGPVSYHLGPGGQLDPVPVTNPDTVWTAGGNGGQTYVPAPPAAADTSFRALTEHLETSGQQSSANPTGPAIPYAHLVGEFNPFRLAGFASAGPGSPLASYRAPLLTGANAASRAALHGQALAPDGNMAGYAQQPPLLLTTLAGAAAIEARAAATAAGGVASGGPAAPIGSIRVRVSGLRGTIKEKLAKIAAVGQEIRKATGLQVIVTAGASAQPVTIGLPAGAFGRPALTLNESWTSIGVALVVLRQADRESVALFVLILAVCALFLGGAALAGVRGRRGEIGALRSLGWRRRQVFTMVLSEVTVLGLAAGLAGTILAIALILGLGLHLPAWRAVLVLPVATVLAALSGLIPAWLAARAEPLDALRPPGRAPRRGGMPVRTVIGLAITGVVRVPGRCALAAGALGAGVAGLAVLLAAQISFRQSIGDSALAGLVTTSTRGTDLAAALLAVGLGAVAVADITYLNLRERSAELAALAAAGWRRAHLGRLLVTEAVLTTTAGALVGGLAGLLAAALTFGFSWPVVAGAAAAAAAGAIAALAATIAILAATTDRPLAATLAADE
jgi:putative ABC transport system permease protein